MSKLRFTTIVVIAGTLVVSAVGFASSALASSDCAGHSEKTFYVSLGGDDGNLGTEVAPWKNFRKVTVPGTLCPGDTVIVKDGTYEDSYITQINDSGTRERPITIRAENKHGAILKHMKDKSPSACSPYIGIKGSYIVIDGFRFTVGENAPVCNPPSTGERAGNVAIVCYENQGGDPPQGFIETESKGCTIRNVLVDRIGRDMSIHVRQDFAIVENSELGSGLEAFYSNGVIFRNNKVSGPSFWGYYIFGKGGIRNMQIYNNTVYIDTAVNDIISHRQIGVLISGGEKDPSTKAYNSLAYNNIVIVNDTGSQPTIEQKPVQIYAMYGAKDSAFYNNIGIFNTTISNGGAFSLELGGTTQTENPKIKNNIIFCNNKSTAKHKLEYTGTIDIDYNNFFNCSGEIPTQVHPVNGDPRFVNPKRDWHLQPGSPAIDSGTQVIFTGFNGESIDASHDKDGRTRMNPWDLGIYAVQPQVLGAIIDWADQANGIIRGWAYDPDTPEKSIDVHFYIDCPSASSADNCLFLGSTKADLSSPTINAEHGITAGKHRFNYRIPDFYLDSNGATKNLRDGRSHTLLIKGIDTGGNGGFLLNASYPFTFTLSGASSIPPTQNSLKYFGYYHLYPDNGEVDAPGNVGVGYAQHLDLIRGTGKKSIVFLDDLESDAKFVEWLNSSTYYIEKESRKSCGRIEEGCTRAEYFENGIVTPRSLINAAYQRGDVLGLYFPDEPIHNGMTNAKIAKISERIKKYFPNIPLWLVEYGEDLESLQIPSSVDWIGFDLYGRLDPRGAVGWMKAYELLKSKLSRPDQKIMLVLDAWWTQISDPGQAILAQVAKNYYELAKSDSNVLGMIGWVWSRTNSSGIEWSVGNITASGLPQNVKDEHRRIADEIIKEPDLFIESVKTFPVREGASPKFKVKIKNQGKEPALASNLGWSIDGGATSTAGVPAILAGASVAVKPQISWAGTAGMHKFVLCADSDHAVIEGHNENNNCSKTEFVVEAATPPAGTDLFIQNVLIDSGIKIKIKNQGTNAFVPTDLSKVVLLVDGVQNPVQKPIRALIPGAAKNFAWKNLALAPGIHSFSVCAWVGDSNNANNCISGRFVVGKQAPLTIAAQARAFSKNLANGAKDLEVTNVQNFLADERYLNASPTGILDSSTQSAIKEFQSDEEIAVTGAWDDATRMAANELLGFDEDDTQVVTQPTPTPTPGVGVSRTPKAGVAQKIIPTADRKLLNGIQQKTNELFGSVADYEKTLRAEQDEEKRGAAKPSVKKPPARAKVSTLKKVASERKKLMIELAEKDPRAFLRNAISKTKRTQLPKQVQSDIEEEITQDATLEVVHYDDFQNPENSYFRYSLLKNKKRFVFYPTRDIARVSGIKVRVKGYALENAIVANVDGAGALQVLADAPPPESVGDQKTLILLLHFRDAIQPQLTAQEIRDTIFNGQFQDYYREQSYGQVSFSGDVFGPYPLQHQCDESYYLWLNEDIERILIENQIPIQNYQRLVLVPDRQCKGAYSSIGRSDYVINGVPTRLSVAVVPALPLSDAHITYPWPYFDFVFAHEMGHSLGVLHANSISCDPPGVLYGQNCAHLEYGNLFDTMGSGFQSLHFNALYKEILGWLNETPVTQSGEITLVPLESQTGRRYAKIQPRDGKSPYYVEYRKPIGFDQWLASPDLASNQNGVFINLVQENSNPPYWLAPWLLNVSPRAIGDSNWSKDWQAVTLNKNSGVWRDVGRGITIGPVTNVTENNATFDVSITDPVCKRHRSLNFGQYFYGTFNPGEKVGISVQVVNRDSMPCGPSEFSYRISSPIGWTFTPYDSPSLVVDPFKTTWVSGEITVPSSVPGEYVVEFTAKNMQSGLEAVVERVHITIAGIPPLALTSPNNGETWQLRDFHWISWNSNVLASEVEAYLERSVNESFEVVGKIVPIGDLQSQTSGFGWYGEINSSGTYAEPGKYYIRIKNISTGEEDRSDQPITLVPYGTVKADLKLDGSDGPIVISADGEHTVSWTSEKAVGCYLGLNGLGEDQSVPASGSRTVMIRRNLNDYAVSIYMSCFSSIGTGYDYVLIQPNLSDFSVDTYRIRKLRTKQDGTHVLVVKAKVKNAGPASAQANVKVTVKKLVKLAEKSSSPKIIPSGQSKKLPLVRVEWKGIPQKYIAEICAMPVGSAIDTNTANDCVSQEITVPPAPAPRAKVSAFTKSLSSSSRGSEVTKVQQCLASELYLETAPTGIYDSQTEAAIKEFQTDAGIQATGVWNADTIKAANDLPCFEEYEPTPSQQSTLSITEARFTGTPSLKINGAAKEFTFTLANSSNQILTGISYKAWIEQNGTKGKEVSKQITCGSGSGKVPAKGCKERGKVGAILPLESGSAIAKIQIIDSSGTVITQTSMPVILTGGVSSSLEPSQTDTSTQTTEESSTETPATPSTSSGQATETQPQTPTEPTQTPTTTLTTQQPQPTPTPTATPPPPQQIALSISEARFTGTPSLKINGAAKEFTFTLANSSNQILTGISYKAWIEQNGTKGKEVSKQITCGPGSGKVPATGCKEYGTISATSPLATSGQAQAVFQIIDSTGAVITQTSIPVTLTGGTSRALSISILAAISGGVESIINSLANWLLGY